jgi:hypothetical protein
VSEADPEVAAERAQVDEAAGREAERAAEHRRRVDRVFGAVLADTTEDERGPGDERGDGTHDDWLRSNVPPHHG